MDCEHNFVFQHVIYWLSNTTVSGSGAYYRYYGDKYYCSKCLTVEIVNTRMLGNSYQKPLDNTFPK